MALLDRLDQRNQRIADEGSASPTLLGDLSDQDRRRILRAVYRGERLSTLQEARAAVEAAQAIRENLVQSRLLRRWLVAGAVVATAGIIYSLVTGPTWQALALPVLGVVALGATAAHRYLRLRPRLDAAERENRVVIEEASTENQ